MKKADANPQQNIVTDAINAHAEDIIMNNVARLHVYIAQMFSQFKENMEIYQGILNGPNHIKETSE